MQAVVKEGQTFSMESVGSAIYTSMAFLNHSCFPNTIKYWEGDRIVLVASQDIKPGDEVTDNYGMHFLNTTRNIRQKWLQVRTMRNLKGIQNSKYNRLLAIQFIIQFKILFWNRKVDQNLHYTWILCQ